MGTDAEETMSNFRVIDETKTIQHLGESDGKLFRLVANFVTVCRDSRTQKRNEMGYNEATSPFAASFHGYLHIVPFLSSSSSFFCLFVPACFGSICSRRLAPYFRSLKSMFSVAQQPVRVNISLEAGKSVRCQRDVNNPVTL